MESCTTHSIPAVNRTALEDYPESRRLRYSIRMSLPPLRGQNIIIFLIVLIYYIILVCSYTLLLAGRTGFFIFHRLPVSYALTAGSLAQSVNRRQAGRKYARVICRGAKEEGEAS